MSTLLFLHGLESSPQGTKARFIRKSYPDCLIPELPPDIHIRGSIIRKLVTQPVCIVGSSFGGLSALLFAVEHPEKVEQMILIAPAVGFFDPSFFSQEDMEIIKQTQIPANIPCTVMIGKHDDVIPQTDIEAMIDRSPDKSLIKVVYRDDDHSLNQSLDVLLSEINEMMSDR